MYLEIFLSIFLTEILYDFLESLKIIDVIDFIDVIDLLKEKTEVVETVNIIKNDFTERGEGGFGSTN